MKIISFVYNVNILRNTCKGQSDDIDENTHLSEAGIASKRGFTISWNAWSFISEKGRPCSEMSRMQDCLRMSAVIFTFRRILAFGLLEIAFLIFFFCRNDSLSWCLRLICFSRLPLWSPYKENSFIHTERINIKVKSMCEFVYSYNIPIYVNIWRPLTVII